MKQEAFQRFLVPEDSFSGYIFMYEKIGARNMGRFTAQEIEYVQSQRLGRLATVNEKGDLHVVPVGFRYNPEHDTIDIGGHNIMPTKKYRDAQRPFKNLDRLNLCPYTRDM